MKLIPPGYALLLSCLPVFAVGCKTRNANQPVQPPAPIPPAQYGQPAPAPGEIPVPPEQSGGRFGYTGTAPAPPAPNPGMRDVRDLAPGAVKPPVTEQKPTPPPAPSAPATSEMPYANSVPGNPLVVTLPGTNASLGQISVEKYDSAGNPTGEALKRGTQVQIPDPNNPGKKIFFKVP
jgi:hypothetical protein